MHKEFDYNQLNELGRIRVAAIRDSFDRLLTDLDHLCPTSREFSLTRTNLETACFFAVKSVAADKANQG